MVDNGPAGGLDDRDDPRADLLWGSVPRLVREAAARFGDREAVVEGRTRISYAELGARVERSAAAAAAGGLRVGDRVAIWAPNTLQWIVAALGAVSAGGVLVPLNTRFKGAEAAYVLQRTRARLLFVTGTFLGTSYVAALRRAAGDGPGGGPLPGLPHLRDVVVLGDDAPEGFRSWQHFLAAGADVPAAAVREPAPTPWRRTTPPTSSSPPARPDTPRAPSSPTPRRCACYGVWSELAGLAEGDRYLVVNPFFHTFGYKAGIIACLMRGATMRAAAGLRRGHRARQHRRRAHLRTAGPAHPPPVAARPPGPRQRTTCRRCGWWSPAPRSIPRRLVERLRAELKIATVLTAYGLTEASGIVTMCRRGDEAATIADTSGRAIPGTEVRVARARRARRGRCWCAATTSCPATSRTPRRPRAAVDGDGWLHTGDIGVLDDRGNLRITDRLKDMYIVGGFNAYPAEIEQLLLPAPGHQRTSRWSASRRAAGRGRRRLSWCAARAPSLTADDLIAWSRREMANYKVPRAVDFVTELPRNASGKVRKGELRAR